jgi:hypothetical protein
MTEVTRVFSQQPDLRACLPKLLQHARRFFAAELEVLADQPELRLHFESARYPGSGTFRISARPSTPDDQFAAEAAEARGRAGGMSLLAARCPAVWVVTAESDVTGSAELQLTALLASVALGPVLPADEETLYGVRGAMERAEKAASSA